MKFEFVVKGKIDIRHFILNNYEKLIFVQCACTVTYARPKSLSFTETILSFKYLIFLMFQKSGDSSEICYNFWGQFCLL